MTTAPSVPDMIGQSRQVLTRPSVDTFERFEDRGGLREALIYVGLFAVLAGLFGLDDGITGFLENIISTLLGFVVFTYLVYWIGKRQGGTGTFDQVAYTFALFWGPLAVVLAVLTLIMVITIIGIFFIPLLGIAFLVANVYFAYLAVRSSMNLERGGKTWGTLILAGLGAFVFNIVVGAITNI